MDDTHIVRMLVRVFVIRDARMIYPHVGSVADGMLPTVIILKRQYRRGLLPTLVGYVR
jgi:hypothetical protein